MKKTFAFLTALCLCVMPVLSAIQEGIGANSAVLDPYFMVMEEKPSAFFSIFTLSGSDFATEFKKGEQITYSFADVISYANVQCSRATFIMERYTSAGQFVAPSWRSGEWSLSGGESKSYAGSVSKTADAVGNFIVTGYLWCLDTDWKTKNPELADQKISKGQEQHKAVYSVVEGTTCLPDGVLSDPYCADGKIIRNIRENCVQKIEVIQECKIGSEFCHVDSCIAGTSGQAAPGEPKPVAGTNPPMTQEQQQQVQAQTSSESSGSNWVWWAILAAAIVLLLLSFSGKFKRRRR